MNKQPTSNYCFVCGRKNPRGLYMAFYDNGRDEVYAEYTIPEDYQGYPGIVHGGVQAAILDVDHSRTVIFLKRSLRPGYSGVQNELFFSPKTRMLFGDAKDSVTALISEVKEL